MAVNHAWINATFIQYTFIPSIKSQLVVSNKDQGRLLVQVVCLLKKTQFHLKGEALIAIEN